MSLGQKVFGPPGSRRRRAWLSLDELGNVIFLDGAEDETMSSHFAKASIKGKWWGRAACKFLNWLDPSHCPHAIEPDRGDPV